MSIDELVQSSLHSTLQSALVVLDCSQWCRNRGCLGEPATPRLAKCPLQHPLVPQDFNIIPMVPALPHFTLVLSHASLPVAGHCAQISVATHLTAAAMLARSGGQTSFTRPATGEWWRAVSDPGQSDPGQSDPGQSCWMTSLPCSVLRAGRGQ